MVLETAIKRYEENALVIGTVRHSQHANKVPLKPWMLLIADGEIETARCTCMAGLGEAC